MATQLATGNITPPVLLWHVLPPRWVEGVEDSASRLRRLTAYEQHDFLVGVVDKTVRDSCSDWECGQDERLPGGMR